MGVVIMLLWWVLPLSSLAAASFILIHAFQQSVGKGFMVLCIPCYILYYLHTEFQHEKKSMIMLGFYGGLIGTVLLIVLGVAIGGGSRV